MTSCKALTIKTIYSGLPGAKKLRTSPPISVMNRDIVAVLAVDCISKFNLVFCNCLTIG
jgi:hypothetical protein